MKIIIFTQIDNVSSDDFELAVKSIRMLCDELKAPTKICSALEQDLLTKLSLRLNDFSSFAVPGMIIDSLRLLEVLSTDIDASISMATDEALMKAIINFLFDDMIDLEGLKYQANEVLLALSSIPAGEC